MPRSSGSGYVDCARFEVGCMMNGVPGARGRRAWRRAEVRWSPGPFDITECPQIKEASAHRVYARPARHARRIPGTAHWLCRVIRTLRTFEGFRRIRQREQTGLQCKEITASKAAGLSDTHQVRARLSACGILWATVENHRVFAGVPLMKRVLAICGDHGCPPAGRVVQGSLNVPSTTVTEEPPIHVLPAASS